MRDTGQYYNTHDMIMVKDVRGETIVFYIWGKEAKAVDYRQATWDKCKFEDPDSRMVATKTLIVRLDYISVDYKLEEESQVDQCRLDNISVDHKGEKVYSKLWDYCNGIIQLHLVPVVPSTIYTYYQLLL